MFTQIRDYEFLPVQFVSALHPGGDNWMTLRCVAANDENKVGLLHVGDGTRIAAVADSAEQTLGRRRLAVAGTIVDVVRANHASRQLLHEVAFLVRTLGRRDEVERGRAIVGFGLRESASDETECFVPAGLAKLVTLANQRSGQAVLAIDVTPAKLSLHASGYPIGRAVFRRHLENVTIFSPDVEAAPHSAIRANSFCLADAMFPHRRFRLGDLKNGSVAGFRFDAVDHVD